MDDPQPNQWSKAIGAYVGVLSTLLALATAELLALIFPGNPSPVFGIAGRVIDLTPADIRENLITVVGTNDKLFLGIGIVLVVLALGAVVGTKFRNRPESAWTVYVILGLVLGVIAAPSAYILWSIAASVIGGLVGWAILVALLRRRVDAETNQQQPALSRRGFLLASGVVAVVAAGGITTIAAIRSSREQGVERVRSALSLPRPVKKALPVPAGAAVDVKGMTPPVTPNDDFYRIDTALTPPTVDVTNWSLSISGKVDNPFTLTYADLMAMPQIQKRVTLACVSNPVGGDLVGNALWQGVPLTALLDRAGVQPGAQQIVGESVDGFTVAFPLELALDGREPLVAVGMNDEPLPVLHGFPARLVVPGLYGYVSATKWLSKIRLTTMAEETPFWVQNGWIADGRIAAASRIDVPSSDAEVRVGNVVVAGRAWHQEVAVGAVEVSVDSGPWQSTKLADSMGIDCWRLWSWNWAATPGQHRIEVRMIDANGTVQSSRRTDPGPGPSSGYDQIMIDVSD